ncbi:hypothetical protein C8J57DRAFT_1251796 [Mycena rebaudengoi]|nr:hypothetical protein C8J57DRAFT_1251796 [Mycena rebaudengoi]
MDNDAQLAISGLRAAFESMTTLQKQLREENALLAAQNAELKLSKACGSGQGPAPDDVRMLKFVEPQKAEIGADLDEPQPALSTPKTKKKKRRKEGKNRKASLNMRLQAVQASLEEVREKYDEVVERNQEFMLELQRGSQSAPLPEESAPERYEFLKTKNDKLRDSLREFLFELGSIFDSSGE